MTDVDFPKVSPFPNLTSSNSRLTPCASVVFFRSRREPLFTFRTLSRSTDAPSTTFPTSNTLPIQRNQSPIDSFWTEAPFSPLRTILPTLQSRKPFSPSLDLRSITSTTVQHPSYLPSRPRIRSQSVGFSPKEDKPSTRRRFPDGSRLLSPQESSQSTCFQSSPSTSHLSLS